MNDADFDGLVDRHGTASVKWDRYRGRDVLPMWIADMDFASPGCVREALARRVEHGVFGYTHATTALAEAIVAHAERTYGWTIEREWLVWLPGAVPALNAACRLVAPSGRVVTATPIYPPFLDAPSNMERGRIEVPLATDPSGRQSLDFDALERAFSDGGKLLLFCNPHNPGGRVFGREELEALAEITLRYDVLVVADELHADLVLEPGLRHRPLATLGPEIAARTITLQAPSKTFNLAGLGFAYAAIPDTLLRRRFRAAIAGILPYVNALAYAAAEAAYVGGWDWQARLLDYLRANRDRITAALDGWPGVRAVPPEATYLYWLDLRGTGPENPVRHLERHGVGLSDGADFGAPGFARLNFGCPHSILDEALVRIAAALRN